MMKRRMNNIFKKDGKSVTVTVPAASVVCLEF